LIRHYADRKQEHVLVTSINGANEVIATRVITVGTVNHSIVHAREVFAEPITDRAAMIILAHNHPSGSVRPSKSDVKVTRRIADAGDLLNIPLIDHIIFSHGDYYSFAEHDWFQNR
jgi:DNA repair protein RadC